MLLAGLLMAVALVVSRVFSEPGAAAPQVAAGGLPAAPAAIQGPAGGDVAASPAAGGPGATGTAAAASGSAAAPATARRVFDTPELTVRLPDPAPVKIGDRDWAVLGTREVVNPAGRLATLVLRDEASGQLDYRQSALRFVLNEGQDYEAFIRSRSNATRLFANPLYGDISVDPANIAAEYTALARDPRVSKVMFIPLEVKPSLK